MQKKWHALRLPPSDEGLVWELFHENSKTSRYQSFLPDALVVAEMQQLHESLPYANFPAIALPGSLTPLKLSLADAIVARVTAQHIEPCALTLEQVATMLYYAYGVTRDNEDTLFVRPFRTIPSGGALYPLEIFFHSTHVEGLAPGIYHYNAAEHRLAFVREGDATCTIAEALVQQNLAADSALIFFTTALFDRTIFKYGDRGYRFVFLEAGHVAQNINLVATALGFGCVNIGGFFDRQVDELLGLDGLMHSTIYLTAIGRRLEDS
jgi:SagB-type dehydrogenase family enzyme